ncbi:MAG: pyruvate kinase, partial [Bacteroidia bacterium]
MLKENFNKTKIIATIGPATSSPEMLESIIRLGVDVCRLNFSHGSHSVHEESVQKIRAINEKLGTHVAILQDLQGPKLRIGKVEGEMTLVEGSELIVSTQPCICTAERLFVSYERLALDAKPGESILLNDGKSALEITEILNDTELKAKVTVGGVLTSYKGFNLPNTQLNIPSMTEKDLQDLLFGLELGVDWVALSFVRKAEDIIALKEIIRN